MRYTKEQLMPKKYPANKPSVDGVFVIHDKYRDAWDTAVWNDEMDYVWDANVDYFIDIPLERGKLVIDVIWETDELIVKRIDVNGPDIFMSETDGESWHYGRTINIDPDELTAFSRHWLDLQGYTIARKEPEILPCPFCGGKCDAFSDREDFYSGVVECERCGYRSRIMQTPDEAIRLHNQISKRSA